MTRHLGKCSHSGLRDRIGVGAVGVVHLEGQAGKQFLGVLCVYSSGAIFGASKFMIGVWSEVYHMGLLIAEGRGGRGGFFAIPYILCDV
jgi:hypothetical protein